ncbi:MAG: arsenic resistance protein [Burkholderiales bacterium]
MMIRVSKPMLEKHQVAVYFIAVFAGLLAATVVGRSSAALEAWINPALAALLYVTFLQVPMTSLRQALTHGRFLSALLIVNFVAVPLVVLGLIQLLPDNPALRFAVLLVLLTPCIDYVVVFTHLGRGDAKLILAATPVLLIAQMLLLPIYLGLFLGADAAGLVQVRPFLNAFFWLIAVPLVLAWLTQYWAARRELGKQVEGAMGWLPVPLMALVLLIVFAAVAPQIGAASTDVAWTVPLYVAFATAMPVVAYAAGKLLGLDVGAGRALAFSAGTRNSLVVLPLAFAVPGGGALIPAVVVTQTLVELVSELVYVRWIPRLIKTATERETL